MTFKRWIKSPKGLVAILLIGQLLIASAWAREGKGLLLASVAVGAAVAADLLFGAARKRKRALPDGAFITGLLIALVSSITTSYTVAALTAALAIGSKHILNRQNKPIFNPAAFGLTLSVVLFHAQQSWWGAFGDLPVWAIPLLLLGGYCLIGRVNKFPQVLVFWGAAFAGLTLAGIYHCGDAYDALRPPFINATLFFGCFMLTDLPTSPAKYVDQAVYGMLTAAIGVLDYLFFGGLIYWFVGLLFGNLYHALRSRRKPGARSASGVQPRSPDRRRLPG